MSEWSTKRIAEQYCCDIRDAFLAENAAWYAENAADVDRLRRRDPDKYARMLETAPDILTPRDSFMWELYVSTRILIDQNHVRAVMPRGFAVHSDVIEMFGKSSVTWTTPHVESETLDGLAHVVVHLLLVDYWDDESEAKWRSENP